MKAKVLLTLGKLFSNLFDTLEGLDGKAETSYQMQCGVFSDQVETGFFQKICKMLPTDPNLI